MLSHRLPVGYGAGTPSSARNASGSARLTCSVRSLIGRPRHRPLASGSMEPIPAPPAEEYDDEGELNERTGANLGVLLPAIGEGFEDETTGGAQAAPHDKDKSGEVEPVN